MGRIWDDRLAEVWAAPRKAGAAVVIGDDTVLTARHVVAGALGGGEIVGRVVRPGAATSDWVRMVLRAHDPAWDLAVLGVDRGKDPGRGAEWRTPSPPSPVFAALATSAEPGCESVGFPDSEVQRVMGDTRTAVVRQTEQVRGTLAPAGQGKAPVAGDRQLPERWMPLDVDGATPGSPAGWGGMSGAGVILPDGRLVGIVVGAEAGHQSRRLYVVPLAQALAQSAPVARALSAALGGAVVVQARDAQLYADVMTAECLGPNGAPASVGEAGLKAFGVKAAGISSEPPFLDYVPRDGDQELRDGLLRALAGDRMLLVVGGSAGGKSRSAAEAARELLGGRSLLCPRQTSLERLRELPVDNLLPALVWLDDVERYDGQALRDTAEWLLRRGIAVVATIRRTELHTRMPKGDLRDPLYEVLSDRELVVEVTWPVTWNEAERGRVSQHVRYPPLLRWVAAGNSPSAWIVAGPALEDRLRDAKADDERPARYALARAVLDWHRTGIAQPCPVTTATGLLQARLTGESEPAEIEDAFSWAIESVTGATRTTKQSLLAKTADKSAVTAHDYVQDADAKAGSPAIPHAVWSEALRQAATRGSRSSIGLAAALQGNTSIAMKAWLPLARQGSPSAMRNLGILLQSSDPVQARRWYEKAAAAGDTVAMINLGALLKDTKPDEARRWWEQASKAGNPVAMYNLGFVLEDSDPVQARHWYEKAAKAGDPEAMNRLGILLKNSEPAQARHWYEKAVDAGEDRAAYNLGLLLEASDPVEARRWYEKAAETGHAGAMNRLGILLKNSEPAQARHWYEKAVDAGEDRAMYNLGLLLEASDPVEARRWYERAAEAGDASAMSNLGFMLRGGEPEQARRWCQKAAEAGDTRAMYNLGRLLYDNGHPGQGRQWWEKAAQAGHALAMFNLGTLLHDSDPAQARQWWEKAAQAGHADAMYNLGTLLHDSDPAQARQWWEKAAQAGQVIAMFNLGTLLYNSEPARAYEWWEKAAEAGSADAMFNLGVLLEDSEPAQARHWYETAAEAGDARAMHNLGLLLETTDPAQALHWRAKSAQATGDLG